MDMQKILPQGGSFELSGNPGKEYRLRLVSVDDWAWMFDTFGVDMGNPAGLGAELQKPSNLFRAVFRLMDIESQKEFVPVEHEEMDPDTGEISKVRVGGYRLFMKRVSGSLADMEAVAGAFAKSVEGSQPLAEIMKDAKKKKRAAKQIGE
jgi:hypothetical protein